MQRVMRAPTLAAVFVTALGSIGTVTAQTYPSRPVTIVVPAPPGGQVDTVARVVIDRMSVALGQPLIIDNVSGASTTIGTGKAARAAPDGYTLSMGNWTSHVGAPAIYPVQFDALNDFEPVALLAVAPTLIVAKKTLPPNNLGNWLPGSKPIQTPGLRPRLAPAARDMSVASISRIGRARACILFPIAAALRPIKICWPVTST